MTYSGGGACWRQGSTSFSHELGDAFQIFCCVAFEALLVAGIHAEMGPVVAVNFGGVLATSGTATIIRAIGVVAVRVVVLRVTRPGALRPRGPIVSDESSVIKRVWSRARADRRVLRVFDAVRLTLAFCCLL